jgi:pilus assembly protein Flp/PilA
MTAETSKRKFRAKGQDITLSDQPREAVDDGGRPDHVYPARSMTSLDKCVAWLVDKAVGIYFAAVRSFVRDEGGAALIEYTMLIGILVLAVIATLIAVGRWITGR